MEETTLTENAFEEFENIKKEEENFYHGGLKYSVGFLCFLD
ncbi:hypothetical protein [Flaviramulus sp. BrNp1-15]|nr:hypothetical protein [Flaviramulus sp. BrNp1-15]